MKQMHSYARLLSVLLVALMMINMISLNVLAAEKVPISNTGYKVVSSKEYAIAPGITETDVLWNDDSGDSQVAGFMAKVSAEALASGKATFVASYKGFYKGTDPTGWAVNSWGMETTTNQAAAYEAATGNNVVIATNADFFNMQTGQPLGVLIMNGVNCNPDKVAAEPYFAILKDGTPVIRPAGTPVDDVQEGVSGPFYLIKDGQVVVGYDVTTKMPCNSIGMTADGDVVTFLTDGRQYPYSVGTSTYEIANYLLDQGVVNAIYLDGGGSATFASEREGSGELKVQSSPSDGIERTVSSALLIVSNVKPSGEFDHAAVKADSSLYMPFCNVQFSASGVDSSGGAAPLPEGLTWALAEGCDGLGSIDAATGLFTSNGTIGAVTAELYQDTTMVGSATVEIKEPDELYFNAESQSLDFGVSSDLGLVVRSENVEMVAAVDGMIWSVDAGLGSMNGNIFTANTTGTSITGNVTVSYNRADGVILTDTIKVEVGKLPAVLFDFEADENGNVQQCAHYHWGKAYGNTSNWYGDDEELTATSVTLEDGTVIHAPFQFDGNFGTAVPAADIFRANGYSFYAWPNNSLDTPQDGQVGAMKVVSEEEGGQVRFGEHALEFNYDYASYDKSQNSNFYMRYCGEDIVIDGVPNEAGVWVYADSRAYGFVFYIQIEVWNGTGYTSKYYPLQHDGNGDGVVDSNDNKHIDFEGWMYLKADISDCAAYYSEEHPFIIQAGQGFLWLSYQPGNGMAGRYAGTVYFDDFQVSYGTRLDDLVNPEVTSITINGQEIADEPNMPMLVTTNDVEIQGFYHDPEGANRTGIDATRVTVEIDGEVITSDNSTESATTRLSLGNGKHSIKVTAYDGAGNAATMLRYVLVNNSATTSASAVLSGASTVTMGSDYALTLNTVGSANTVAMKIGQINGDFGQPTVTWADGWSGEVAYVSTGFKRAAINITAQYTGEGAVPADAQVLTMAFSVPSTLDPEIDFFTYQVLHTETTDTYGNTNTTAQPAVKLNLSAYYTVLPGIAIAGKPLTLSVVDNSGAAAAGVNVYINGAVVGVTDENGSVTTADAMVAGTISLNASDAQGRISFTTRMDVMAVAGITAPTGISLPATTAPETNQLITWLSPVDGNTEAYVNYATAVSAEDGTLVDPLTATGTSVLHAFTVDKQAAHMNSVELKDLVPGTIYYYQVGDGEVWSEVCSFTTQTIEDVTEFFVIGDTQMNGNFALDEEPIGYLNTIGTTVAGKDFGIQTGDYVDNGGDFAKWHEIQSVFQSAFPGIPMVHTNGNHEYYGDAEGYAAQILLGQDDCDYYSVTYGNVYIAVIHNVAKMEEALAWLVEDAAASKAPWKVLSVHEPIYYTNSGAGSAYHTYMPEKIEQAGIDVVFSGHDHSYARKVDDSGIVYYICGDLGAKSRNINYKAEDNGFGFSMISQDYTALHLTVSAEKVNHDGTYSMTIEARDIDGSIIDSYEVTKTGSCVAGHVYTTYDNSTDELICDVCGERHPAADEYYNGFVTDINTGKTMLLIGGNERTNHVYYNEKHYFLDNEGFAFDGAVTICGEICNFEDGLFINSENTNVKDAGMAGVTAEYVMYTDGRFVLGGSGATDRHDSTSTRPWDTYKTSILSVEIGSGITELGVRTFDGLTQCTSLVFAENGSLTTIGGNTFYYMENVTAVTIPSGVKSIGVHAFGNCARLESIYIPNTVTSIHKDAFSNGNAQLVIKTDCNNTYTINWTQTYGKTCEKLHTYISEVVPPTCITEGYTNHTCTTCNDNYKDTVTEKLPHIYETVVTEPTDTEQGYTTYICAVCEHTYVSDYVDPLGHTFVNVVTPPTCTTEGYTTHICDCGETYIDSYISALGHSYNEGVVTKEPTDFENGIKTYTCTVCNDTYDEVIPALIAAPITGVCGENIEWKLDHEGTLTLNGSGAMTAYASNKDVPWYENRRDIKKVVIDAEITSLCKYAFYGASNCTSIVFGEGSKLETIGAAAFYYMSGLTEVALPANVTKIDNMTFAYCKNLASVYVPDGVTYIHGAAFGNTGAALVLNVVENSYAQQRAEALGIAYTTRAGQQPEEPDVPDVPETPEVVAEYQCGADITAILTSDGTLTLNGSGAMNAYASNKNVPWYEARRDIKKVVIDAEITSLCKYAFYGASNCTSIVFGEGSKLETIGAAAFYYMSGLTEVALPANVTKIDNMTFAYCKNLASVYVPDGVTYIHGAAFVNGNANVVLNVANGSYAHQWATNNGFACTTR